MIKMKINIEVKKMKKKNETIRDQLINKVLDHATNVIFDEKNRSDMIGFSIEIVRLDDRDTRINFRLSRKIKFSTVIRELENNLITCVKPRSRLHDINNVHVMMNDKDLNDKQKTLIEEVYNIILNTVEEELA